MTEWPNVAVSKTVERERPVGSNPTLSATEIKQINYGEMLELAGTGTTGNRVGVISPSGFESLSLRHLTFDWEAHFEKCCFLYHYPPVGDAKEKGGYHDH